MNIRIKQMQEKLKDQNISAVVLRLPENIVLFSQYWPRNGFSFIFIPAEGEACVIVPHVDQKEANEGSIEDVRVFGWVRIKDGKPFENVAQLLKELAKQYGIKENSIIGVEKGFDQAAQPLCSGEILLPGDTTLKMIKGVFRTENLMDVNNMIGELRTIKNSFDIKKIQICNEIAYKGIEYFIELTKKPGIREIDIAADVEAYIAKEASGYRGATYGKAWVQISSGVKTADEGWFAGVISSSREIQQGDFVMLEMATVVDGYWCDLTKTTIVGNPTEEQQRMFDVVEKAQRTAIQNVQEGAIAGDIDSFARNVIIEEGFGEYFVHITGHGVGFGYHESGPIIAPNSKQILKAGMIHSIEPGIYIPGVGGVRMEVNVLIEKDGSRVLGK